MKRNGNIMFNIISIIVMQCIFYINYYKFSVYKINDIKYLIRNYKLYNCNKVSDKNCIIV